ncbi:plexin domain-containing protein 2 isoform X2 [Palaemon carinicauda]|uniref:plexin domain-containing protein 2 isoform X2 n=1 Tax=Palaemon carinicauda TaxID=392227 RepID=UPI0035B5B609
MAGQWCRVVSLLSILVIFILNTSYAHIDAAEKYFSYEGELGIPGEWGDRPLIRLRREENLKDKDGEKPISTGKKPTVPAKNTKVSKVSSAKSKLLLKTVTSDDSLSVETPSSVKTSNNDTSATTTTTTTTTSITTTTTSSPTTNPVPISNDDSPAVVSSTEGASSENVTGGAMPVDLESKSTATPDIPKNDTDTGATDATVKSVNTQPLDDDDEIDPDSGNDEFQPITDYKTKNTTIDHHRYYTSLTVADRIAQQYWVNLDTLSEEVVIKNEMLSDSHRRAATVTLKFDFPFYGHMLRNITIATGGFLFTGDFVHTWLAATQYIAPLMANFDTSVSEDACVKYADNGTAFTVQWDKVKLKDHQDAGTFTFQATLHRTGDITFIYKQIPVTVTSIHDDEHPVKVGLSDAYIVDRTIFYVRRKTIYEYHKIDMKKTFTVGNWTAILFKALPTCMTLNTCDECLSTKISFQCNWCNKIGRCSTGLDRYRQDWLSQGCENLSLQDVEKCAVLPPPPTYPAPNNPSRNAGIDTFGQNASVEPYSKVADEGQSSVGGVVAMIFLLGLVLGVGGWVAYAYFYPHSTSGQILIRYRPSTWSWKRGEARYTAASIHSIHM